MNTVGIIAEYDPFHTGHAHHIRKAKEASGADYAVVVMSPDFVQRGEPALLDKFTRARMALQNGADLVIELPVCYATGSAEYFARGAAALLDRLGVVDFLCFGAEQADPGLFDTAAAILAEEPPEYAARLRELLRQGETFPRARSEALLCCLSHDSGIKTADTLSILDGSELQNASCVQPLYADKSAQDGEKSRDAQDLTAFLASPNNILGVEYCKALRMLHSSIRPLPVSRDGNRFGSLSLDGTYCSASAIRHGVQSGASPDALLRHIPANCRALFLSACENAVTTEELLPFLVQKLLSMDSFDSVLDISADLSERIRNLRYACIGKTYREIVSLLKTRQLTDARVRRALLHLILDIRTDDVLSFRSHGTVYYAKVLGLRRDASPLLRKIRDNTSLPFLTKSSLAAALPDPYAQRMWRQDVFASQLYRSILSGRTHSPFRSECEISPVIL